MTAVGFGSDLLPIPSVVVEVLDAAVFGCFSGNSAGTNDPDVKTASVNRL